MAPRKRGTEEAKEARGRDLRRLMALECFIEELPFVWLGAQVGATEATAALDKLWERVRAAEPAITRRVGRPALERVVLEFCRGAAGLPAGRDPLFVDRLSPDVDASYYETTAENIDRVRAAVQPGQVWLHVRGPRIGKLEGYIEERLRVLKRHGFDVEIGDPGRPPDISDEDCIEAARLKDDEGWTYRRISERFGWPLDPDDVTGQPDRRPRKAMAAVKRGRALR